MPGKTVRIDAESYTILIKEQKRHPGMSLSDLADIAIQKTYKGENNPMASELTNEKILEMLGTGQELLLRSKDEQIQELKETLERERELVDILKDILRKVNVSKDSQTDTQLKKN